MRPVSDNPKAGPELSIIVPVLNEIEQLPEFCEALENQHSVDYEILVCDGGSEDGSLEWLRRSAQTRPALRIVHCPSGRGRQLNRGVQAAAGEWCLFLHVDSRFDDPSAIHSALAFLKETGSYRVAGHYPLIFRRSDATSSLAYRFYELKTRTGRPETVHGDQGFLVHRCLMETVGPFREDLPVMEDTDFAERLRLVGQWRLLPAVISTSARRFETEGLWQRQLLGALLMCFRSVGWNDFFDRAPEIYRQQNNTDQLRVGPYFDLIRGMLAALPYAERWQIWSQCGSYVRRHGWQLFFLLDVARAHRSGLPHEKVRFQVLAYCEPVFDVLTDNRLGRLVATLLLRIWFSLSAFIVRTLENKRAGS